MHSRKFGRIGLAAIGFTLMAAGSASAAGCTAATLSGGYGAIGHGYDASNQPTASVLRFTADGAGNVTAGTGTGSKTGTIGTATFTGTYKVASTCTGTMILSGLDGAGTGAAHIDFVLDDAHKGFQFIRTDSGHSAIGFGLAQGVSTCSVGGTRSSTYAEEVYGYLIPSGGVAMVGRIVGSPKGVLSGSDTINTNGTIVSHKITGSYTLNSDCTGTAQVKAGTSTYNFATVQVNGGSDLFVLETDANTVVGGTLEK